MAGAWSVLAERCERRAADLERAARGAGSRLPAPAHFDGRALLDFTRPQWRDAGMASVLREVADFLRSGAAFAPRLTAWLTARQLECDLAADAAMQRLTDLASGPATDRPAVIARSAYAVGRAKGVRAAADLLAEATLPT